MWGSESKRIKQRLEAQQAVLPPGCHGRVSVISAEVVRVDGNGGACRVRTSFGCAGLVEGLVELDPAVVTANTGMGETGMSNRIRRKVESHALLGKALALCNICAECPIGQLGQQRETAREVLAERDIIGSQLDLAQKQQDVAEAQERAARAQIELLRLQQGQSELPPAQVQPPSQA